MRDSRQFYADDVAARLVFNASGGSVAAYSEAVGALAEAVAAFARFANAALDTFFMQHHEALQRQ